MKYDHYNLTKALAITLMFSLSPALSGLLAQPANDLCGDAVLLDCSSDNVSGTTTGATSTDSPNNCFSLSEGVWYQIEGNGEDITVTVSPGDWDPELSLSTGSCGDLTGVECEDAGLTGDSETIVIDSETGTTYYLYVGDWSSSTTNSNSGSFDVTVSCPEPCLENTVEVELFDSFGDGWNGNELDIVDENNQTVATATLETGSSGTETFCLPDGCYTVNVGGGSFQSEVSWDIFVNGESTPSLSGGAPQNGLELEVNSSCSAPCEDNVFTLELNFDSFADENSWEVKDENGNTVASNAYTSSADNTTVQEPLCLPDGCYELYIFDSFGDGIFGTGDYTLFDEAGSVVASGEVTDGGGLQASFDAGAGCGPSCDIAITGSSSTPETCPGDNDGSITVNASCSSCSGLEYSVGAGFQASNVFTGLAAGNYTVTARDSGDPACSATTTVSVGAGTGGNVLPPWSTSDVGSTGFMGNDYSQNPCNGNGTFTISGGGNNGATSTTDAVAFVKQTLCGDGSITAKIESVGQFGYGGLMIRESSAPGAKQASVFSNLTNVLRWEDRAATNGAKTVQAHYRPFPIWLRLERQGDWILGYYSTTGSSFSYVHAAYVPMSSCVEIGMASFATTVNVQGTATFSNVTVTGGGGVALETPEGWNADPSQAAEATLFPNPVRDLLTIELGSDAQARTRLVLRNELGQMIRQRVIDPGSFRKELNVSDLANGVYLIELRRDGEPAEVLRFVKH